jgi:hypothetical protein
MFIRLQDLIAQYLIAHARIFIIQINTTQVILT